MNEQTVSAWARMLRVELPDDRIETVTAQLEGQIAQGGGLPADDVEEIEPATVFEPEWRE
ncbi:MAG: hypothetical protein E6I73_06135 [Chloroflexi bacterium]|nr:MAG: hypothetical protein E6I73_06135 [Chloroflexota bacterium]